MKPRRPRPAAATLVLIAVLLSGSSCASSPSEPDRAAFLAHVPRSILVLPPRNETPEADAASDWLATITRPLAERGYYVFPVAIVAAMMKDGGQRSPRERHEESFADLGALFGADAVLDVDIREWGWSDRVAESELRVTVAARLVDVKSGTELWSGTSTAIQGQEDKSPVGVVGTLFGGIAAPISRPAVDVRIELARQANWGLLHSPQGLPLGPHHPGFEEDQRKRRAAAAATAP
jgi:hypothetical protein